MLIFQVKGTIWFIVELVLYINGISKYCNGGIYAYGIILFVANLFHWCFNGLLLLLVLTLRNGV